MRRPGPNNLEIITLTSKRQVRLHSSDQAIRSPVFSSHSVSLLRVPPTAESLLPVRCDHRALAATSVTNVNHCISRPPAMETCERSFSNTCVAVPADAVTVQITQRVLTHLPTPT